MPKIYLYALLLYCMVPLFFANPVSLASPSQFSSEHEMQWSLNKEGVLTIEGTGDMKDYLEYHSKYSKKGITPPWSVHHQDDIKRVILQDGITSIGSWAFYGCRNLTSIYIPNSVTSIGAYAFEDCINIERIDLPDSIAEIGDGAFNSCLTLNNIHIPSGITHIGENAFDSCPRLGELPVQSTTHSMHAAKSNNRNGNKYDGYHAQPVRSNLYADGDHLVRVECIGGQIVVETYTDDFRLISSRTLSSDLLALWGGFYAGRDYNFIVLGKKNYEEQRDAEVLRVIKYDKNWNKMGQASLLGANTVEPFAGGSLRCDEYNGILYLHTCHKMYRSRDKLNHQANMMLAVRQDTMSIVDAQYNISNDYGYVSHSFNQFLLIDRNHNILTLDQGDAYPRAAVLQRYRKKAGAGSFAGNPSKVELRRFPENQKRYQQTGACLGGLSESTDAYIVAFCDDEVGGMDDQRAKNIFLASTDKKNFSASGTKTIRLTDYVPKGDYSAGTPSLVPDESNGGYVLWDVCQRTPRGNYISTGNIAYVRYLSDGRISNVAIAKGKVSDCQPIFHHGRVIWYVTENSTPIFYTLDSSRVSSHVIADY